MLAVTPRRREHPPAGAKVAVCELPFDYKSSETKGGVGGT